MPPSTNQLFVWLPRTGKRIKTAEYRAWREQAKWAIKLARAPTIRGDVLVEIEIGPRGKTSDLDNRLKAILDSLVEMRVIEDDRKVWKIIAEWSETITGCKVMVTARQAP